MSLLPKSLSRFQPAQLEVGLMAKLGMASTERKPLLESARTESFAFRGYLSFNWGRQVMETAASTARPTGQHRE
jgi:hypothetical protein